MTSADERIKAIVAGDIEPLIASWRCHLRAGNLSPRTIRTYTEAATQFIQHVDSRGMPRQVAAIRREHVEDFIEHLVDTRSASTAANRFRSLQQLFKWLADEGEIEGSPMARMRVPKVEEREIPIIAADDIHKLLKACSGNGFEERRDTAIILMLLDTGAPAVRDCKLGV